MAKNTPNDLTYFLALDVDHEHYLGAIRSWENVKMAHEDQLIWVKDLSWTQIESVEIKTIPYKSLYYAKENKLFPLHSLLPERNVPSVLWTPIERAIVIELPSLNHNYFGVEQKLDIQLVQANKEEPAYALLVEMESLQTYIQGVAAVRLEHLQWVVINHHQALITGTPLLPISGQVLWEKNDFLFPAGYDFELNALVNSLDQLLNSTGENRVIWQTDGSYFLVKKNEFRPLSLSSFQQTFMN